MLWLGEMVLGFKIIQSVTYWCYYGKSARKSKSCSVVYDSLWPHGLYSPWNSPGQKTGVGSLSLLQGIFPSQELEPRCPALPADSLPAEPQGSPRILEWVDYPFSRGSSRPRNRTGVSCIAGGFFTNWAMRVGGMKSSGRTFSPGPVLQ